MNVSHLDPALLDPHEVKVGDLIFASPKKGARLDWLTVLTVTSLPKFTTINFLVDTGNERTVWVARSKSKLTRVRKAVQS